MGKRNRKHRKGDLYLFYAAMAVTYTCCVVMWWMTATGQA